VKARISPAVVALVVVIACSTVLVAYWRGLVHDGKKTEKAKMKGGGGMPPPPLLGLPTVTVTTLAGNGEAGLQDGKSAAARFDGPSAVAVGPGGVLYVTDSRNHRLRQVTAAGEVTTIAGTGPHATVVGDFQDGPAASARLWNPSGIVALPDGTIYFTDTGNHRVRYLRAGQVGTLAGGDTPRDDAGIPTGGFAEGAGPAARFRFPTGLCRAPDGSLLVVDTGNLKLRQVTLQGATSTVADLAKAGVKAPFGVAAGADGIYLTDPGSARVLVVRGGVVSPVPDTPAAPSWKLPTGIAVGAKLYLADAGAHCLLAKTQGVPVLLAGVVPIQQPWAQFNDGPGDKAGLACPSGLALSADSSTIYVADYGNCAIRVVRWR
jgi:sugar lactone lactonase YvrE